MRFDSGQLFVELTAAGLVVAGCRSDIRVDQDGSDDVTQIIDWLSGHPTKAERDIAAGVLLAHDSTKRVSDEVVAKQRLLTLAGQLEAGTATPTDVREALAKIIRRLVH